MSDVMEYCCFIGGLAWATSDRGLREAFEKFGHLLEARVAVDKVSGRSRGFGFVTFDERKAMEDAIDAMNGMDLDGRTITVEKAQPLQHSGRDHDRPRDRDRDRGHGQARNYGGSRGSGSGECFKCGKPGHFARECPGEGGRGSKYGGSHGGGRRQYGPDRNGDKFGGRSRDTGSRYSRDRSGPYERRGTGSYRSG